MPFIDLLTDEAAEGDAAAILAALRAAGGVPNHARLTALRPRVHRAWRELLAAITEDMDPRRYELVTLAAARALGSSYCMLAHAKVLLDGGFHDAAQLRAIAIDHRSAGLDAVDVAVMDLAAAVATDAASVTGGDIDRLLDLGLTQAEVVDVVLAAAARCFFSSTLEALGVDADAAYAGLDPALRDALTVGRPIASSGSSASLRRAAG